jgi:hypothetical protein
MAISFSTAPFYVRRDIYRALFAWDTENSLVQIIINAAGQCIWPNTLRTLFPLVFVSHQICTEVCDFVFAERPFCLLDSTQTVPAITRSFSTTIGITNSRILQHLALSNFLVSPTFTAWMCRQSSVYSPRCTQSQWESFKYDFEAILDAIAKFPNLRVLTLGSQNPEDNASSQNTPETLIESSNLDTFALNIMISLNMELQQLSYEQAGNVVLVNPLRKPHVLSSQHRLLVKVCSYDLVVVKAVAEAEGHAYLMSCTATERVWWQQSRARITQ